MRRVATILICLLAAVPLDLRAQPRLSIPGLSDGTPAPEPQPDPGVEALVEAVRARRRELSAEMAEVAGRVQAASEGAATELAEVLSAKLELLERIDGTLRQLRSALRRKAELESEHQAFNDALSAADRGAPSVEPPYDLEALDRLRARSDNERARTEPIEAGLEAATAAMRQAADARDAAPARIAAAERRVDAAVTPETRRGAHRELSLAELRARSDATLAELHEVELDNARRRRTSHDLRLALLERKLTWVRLHLDLTPADLEKPLARIERDTFILRNDINSAKLEATSAERALQEVEARLAAATAPNPALVEEAAAARLALMAHQQTVAVMGEQLERLQRLRTTWERRYAVLTNGATPEQLDTWLPEAQAAVAELERDAHMKQARLAALRASRGGLLSRLARADADDTTSPFVRQQDSHLARVIEIFEAELAKLGSARALTQWQVDEVQAARHPSAFSERFGATRDSLVGFWRYRLTTIDAQPITFGKLVSALLLLILGFISSRFLARLLGRRLLPRFGLNPGGSAALQTLTFYTLLVVFTLVALDVVNVPLTAFTVLGGALAIGVGFGSQNVVNNFISGLILLIEQPIKVNDLIEVDGTAGTVEHIGPRSTRVRSFANIHMIVPNSSFLEKNVVNWTLSDTLVRVDIKVGVAYGSPTRDVAKLLHQAVTEHPDIEKHPEPMIFFADFADNSLNFEVLFWIRISTQIDRRRIQSDVRFRIDELFHDAGITIAFPQRDVHLDTLTPLDVRVLPAAQTSDNHS